MKQLAYLTGGLLLGLFIAAIIGWGLFPNYVYDHSPAGMRYDYQEEYIRLTAISYQLDGDLDKAAVRLSALGDTPNTTALVSVTERYIQNKRSERLIIPLVNLAYAFEVNTPPMAAFYRE